jgi:hypothetical protein
MANRRMISKSISTSKKVNDALVEKMKQYGKAKQFLAILLYTWLHPHADDFGRLDGDPYWIKLNIFPGLANAKLVNESDIVLCLDILHDVNLIVYYQVSKKWYIQIINFDEHQTGLNKRTESKFPAFQGNSEKFSEIPA